jgi:hypothetical protein
MVMGTQLLALAVALRATGAAAPPPPLYVRASFEPPVLVGQSSSTYYHFPAQIMWLRADADDSSGGSDRLVMAVSNSFDTAKSCTANCSRLMQSTDMGRSWTVGLLNPTLQLQLSAAARAGLGAPCAGPDCVITGPAFLEQPGRLRLFASSARPGSAAPAGNSTWSPDLQVASGSVLNTAGVAGSLVGGPLPNVTLRHPPPLMAPTFGLAVGQTVPIRTKSNNQTAIIMVSHGFDWLPPIGRGVNKTTVYVLRSDDEGQSFTYLSRVPCRATGPMAHWCAQNIGGPSEPALTQLADGRLLLLFRTTGTPLMKALSSVRHAMQQNYN